MARSSPLRRALIAALWRGGLRISEALALNETDLDQQRGSRACSRAARSSGSRTRRRRLPPDRARSRSPTADSRARAHGPDGDASAGICIGTYSGNRTGRVPHVHAKWRQSTRSDSARRHRLIAMRPLAFTDGGVRVGVRRRGRGRGRRGVSRGRRAARFAVVTACRVLGVWGWRRGARVWAARDRGRLVGVVGVCEPTVRE